LIISSFSALLVLISWADWPRGGTMARPLRLNLPGGFYHVTSRGNERKEIFAGEEEL